MTWRDMDDLCYNKAGTGFRAGQAALEYILAFAGLLAVAAIMWGVVGASEKQSERAVRIVTSEYP